MAQLSEEARLFEKLGFFGKAVNRLEAALGVADRIAASDPAYSSLCVELRMWGAKVARAGGRLQESLELSEAAILKSESTSGRCTERTVQARLYRAATLLDLSRRGEAEAAYREVLRILDSTAGMLSLQVEATIGLGVVLAGAADSKSSIDFFQGAAKVGEKIRALVEGDEDPSTVASALERIAGQFERTADFSFATKFAEASLSFRRRSAPSKLTPEIRSALETLSRLYCKAGKADEGIRVSGELLRELEAKFGEASPETMEYRGRYAAICFENGRWDTARLALERNVVLAEASPKECGLVSRMVAVRDFLYATGRNVAAATTELAIRRVQELDPHLADAPLVALGPVSKLVQEQFVGAGSSDGAVVLLAEKVDAALKVAWHRLAAGDLGQGVCAELDVLEEQSVIFPDRIASKVEGMFEEVRNRSAETPEQLRGAIEAGLRRIAAFQHEEGRSKELTRAKLYQELAPLFRRAGKDTEAAQVLQRTRGILRRIGLKEERAYGEVLLLSARVSEPELAAKMRIAARKILRKFREL